jgi:hypothetical protein
MQLSIQTPSTVTHNRDNISVLCESEALFFV